VRVRFASFVLDLDTRQLTRGSRPVQLSPKAFELLALLVADRPKVLARSVLQERLWPRTFVSDANLSNLIAELRAALRDSPRFPRFIRTAHGFGYAFCADATAAGMETTGSDIRHWIEWNGRRFPLAAGEHIVGRDADASIRIDHSTVSRRHARLNVTARGTILEDVSSKNGTFRGEVRLTSPVQLVDGDAIRVGSVLMTFHALRPFGTTATAEAPR